MVDQLYGAFNSQIFSLFVTLILAAAAFSGKLNMNASVICLALAWFVGCVGIYKSAVIKDWYLMISTWLALGSILALLMSWFQPPISQQARLDSSVAQPVPPPIVRDAIRWDLKPHFTRGFDLLTFYKSPENRDEEAWQEWVQEVTAFLRNRLSESHVDRWNSRDGIDPPSSLSVDVPGRNRKIYADVSFRLERLAEFDREMKH